MSSSRDLFNSAGTEHTAPPPGKGKEGIPYFYFIF
jgi:hypothetical protein